MAEYLQNLIHSGDLTPGDQLPSEAELCEKFGSSRGPVRQAVATLRAEGLVSSGRGRRSMVLSTQISNSFDALLSATAFFEEGGHKAGAKIIRIARELASETVADALELKQDDPVVEIMRVRTADDLPVMVEKLVFPTKWGEPLMTLTPHSPSVHKQLREMGAHVDNIVRTALITQADSEQAELLGIAEGAPLIHLTLRASTYQGEPVEFAEYYVRGDVITIDQSNVRGGSVPVKLGLKNPKN
ncbi:GntR family transcriptional regulator [Corynebacterium tuscaniense]|uniref:GntR family transcriptional regulator n=1 Tax=Corynebacterium tuscaniense TaxID=302449 RepID=UPI0021556507|nr:GntR family transcriptional regulator [Corynebacterium tuscaniense]